MAVYKRDIVDINLETGNIHRSFLKHSIGYKDAAADHFGIRVFRNGEPVSLTGVSVQGIFMPPQGDPIAITTGNIVSGNEAEVVLPQACYNYDGQFTLAIKLVDPSNAVTGTMRIVDGMVDNTNASGTVAPVAAIPSYQEVLSTYEQAIAAINKTVRFDATQSLTDTQKATARTNIGAVSTAEMNTALEQKVNVSDIENDLTGTTAGKVLDARQGKVLDDKVSDLKSVIETKLDRFINLFDPDDEDVEVGCYYNYLNQKTTNSAWSESGYIPVTAGAKYRASNWNTAPFYAQVVFFDGSKNFVIGYNQQANGYITAPNGASYIRIAIPNNIKSEISFCNTEVIPPTNIQYNKEYINVDEALIDGRNILDYSEENRERIRYISGRNNLFNTNASDLVIGQYIDSVSSGSPVWVTDSRYGETGKIPATPGKWYALYSPSRSEILYFTKWCWFDSNDTIISFVSTSQSANKAYKAPDGASYFRVSITKATYTTFMISELDDDEIPFSIGDTQFSAYDAAYTIPQIRAQYATEAEAEAIRQLIAGSVSIGAQWENKKWYGYGTSITNTSGEGKYATYLAQMSGMQFTNKGISGGGIGNFPDSGAFSRGQVYSAICNTTDGKLEADIITLETGANDAVDGVPFGTIYDTGTSTLAGCLNDCLRYLQANTNAQIVVLPSPDAMFNDSSDWEAYCDWMLMVEKICMINRVHFIKTDANMGYGKLHSDKRTMYLVDSIHHTELGGFIMAQNIWYQLRNIPCFYTTIPT